MIDCMETCPKMQEARAPYTDNMEQLREVMDTVSDIVMVPGTQFRYPNTGLRQLAAVIDNIFWGSYEDFTFSASYRNQPITVGTIFWGTHTDAEEEGTWVNYYTKERVDQELVDNAIGGVSSSRLSNCAVIGSIFNGWLDWKCLLMRNIFQKH